MAAVGRIMVPIAGKCLGVNWFKAPNGCPDTLDIIINDSASKIAVNFAGRGKVGPSGGCGGADAYVSFPVPYVARIDVMAALRAGIWTSSTTILVYVGNDGSSGWTLSGSPTNGGTPNPNLTSVGTDVAACGTTLRGTFTVTDAGGLTVV